MNAFHGRQEQVVRTKGKNVCYLTFNIDGAFFDQRSFYKGSFFSGQMASLKLIQIIYYQAVEVRFVYERLITRRFTQKSLYMPPMQHLAPYYTEVYTKAF